MTGISPARKTGGRSPRTDTRSKAEKKLGWGVPKRRKRRRKESIGETGSGAGNLLDQDDDLDLPAEEREESRQQQQWITKKMASAAAASFEASRSFLPEGFDKETLIVSEIYPIDTLIPPSTREQGAHIETLLRACSRRWLRVVGCDVTATYAAAVAFSD